MKQKISIITVCYNAEKEIEKTLRSVENQTFKDYEFIIVDGASKDSTIQIIQRYLNIVTCVVSEKDNGIYDAMNKGIKIASGEWIIMLNAGDVFADDSVLENVFKINIPDDINVLYSDYYHYLSDGTKIKGIVDLKNKPSFNHQCTIYRRKLHDLHGYYIVTPKIIISDILFFYSIPSNQMQKIDTVIAIFDRNGISSHGNWSLQQWLCADVIFRKRTFTNMVLTYYSKKIKKIIPQEIKFKLKHILFGKSN